MKDWMSIGLVCFCLVKAVVQAKEQDFLSEQKLRDEMEKLNLEAEELQREGLIRTARGLFEAAGSGMLIAQGNLPMGVIGVGFAAHEVEQGCKEFNKGIVLEQQAEEIQEQLSEEEPQKSWWQFWK